MYRLTVYSRSCWSDGWLGYMACWRIIKKEIVLIYLEPTSFSSFRINAVSVREKERSISKLLGVLNSTHFGFCVFISLCRLPRAASCTVFREREGTSRKREIYEKPPKGRGCFPGNVVLIGWAGRGAFSVVCVCAFVCVRMCVCICVRARVRWWTQHWCVQRKTQLRKQFCCRCNWFIPC